MVGFVKSLGFRVQGLGSRVYGLGFGVWASGFRAIGICPHYTSDHIIVTKHGIGSSVVRCFVSDQY